jgi:hypothetical protein
MTESHPTNGSLPNTPRFAWLWTRGFPTGVELCFQIINQFFVFRMCRQVDVFIRIRPMIVQFMRTKSRTGHKPLGEAIAISAHRVSHAASDFTVVGNHALVLAECCGLPSDILPSATE